MRSMIRCLRRLSRSQTLHIISLLTFMKDAFSSEQKMLTRTQKEKLLRRKESTYWPTHGSSIDNVHEFVKAFISHRLEREEQILSCLKQGVNSISDMIPIMYSETDPSLHPAAARSAFAAIIRLVETGRVSCDTTEPKIDAEYFLS